MCQCPLTKYHGGLQSLDDVDDSLIWLENTVTTALSPRNRLLYVLKFILFNRVLLDEYKFLI